jgi:hypothetical protein
MNIGVRERCLPSLRDEREGDVGGRRFFTEEAECAGKSGGGVGTCGGGRTGGGPGSE